MNIPFVFGKLATGDNFTDRQEETARLRANFANCINTIIISPRRWGKSSLVHKAAALALSDNPDLRVCHIDLFNILNAENFYNEYAKAIIQATSSRLDEFIANAKKFLASLTPKITIGSLPGEEISLSLDFETLRLNPNEVLNLPEKIALEKGIKICVCIDEFQKISEWENSDYLQGKFRSFWQHHQHVGYCLYGSKRHMMMDIFTDSSKPFYRFGDLIFLKKIPGDELKNFIKDRFRESDKEITEEAAALIADTVSNHPYYCQQLAQLCWLRCGERCDEEVVRAAHISLVEQLSLLFANLTEELTPQQLSYLKAILSGETAITSTEVMVRYGISSATAASRSKNALVARDILDFTEGIPQFLDPIYRYWLAHSFFRLPHP